MRSSSLPWQAAALLLCASTLVVSCSSKHSGSPSMLPTVPGNGTAEVPIAPAAVPGSTSTRCCAAPEMQALGVTVCYSISNTALADPRYVAARGICTVGATCYYGCTPAGLPGRPGTGTTRP